MQNCLTRCGRWLPPFGLLLSLIQPAQPAPGVLNPNLSIRQIMNTATGDDVKSIRIVKDPRNNRLYYLRDNGDIYEVNLGSGSAASTSTKVFTASDHGIKGASGLAIGPDRAIYVIGNTSIDNNTRTFATIAKGALDATGKRIWEELMHTEPYPRSNTYFNHVFNGIVVSPDGQYVFVNSGSRTDHGEEQTFNGLFPNTRDVPLTTKIFRLPANLHSVLFTNGTAAGGLGPSPGEKQPGAPVKMFNPVFAEGIRNSYDLAFAPNGDLFGAENGPDRDTPDELNWLREGQHYGFPWRMGGQDTPQQFPNYDPSKDKLIDPRYTATYRNDPTYPPPPTQFAEPVINLGPDADKFRDPSDGTIKDASDLGLTFSTFTPHRSPLGLVFDVAHSTAAPFTEHGFVLSWTKGDPDGTSAVGPFKDASQDMLDLELTKLGNTNYQARVTRVVGGFANPIDAEIVWNKIYVIEYGGDQGIWEVTFPGFPENPAPTISSIPDQNFDVQSGATPVFTFTVGDAPPNATSAFNLQVTVASSNQTLVPNANLFLGGQGANRTISIQPAAGQEGESTVTLTVTDQGPDPVKSASTSFKVTVVNNSAPTMSSIANQTVERDTSTAALPFAVNDSETAAASLVVSARSDNTSLVPSSGIVFGGSGSDRTVTVTPARDQVGTARITMTVTDGGGKTASNSFTLTVTQPPVVNGDFNQDGRADLLFQSDDGFLAAWLMNGTELSSAAFLTPSQVGDAGFRIVGSGDFNRDGQQDILFQHTDGTLAVWLMHGTALDTAVLLKPSHPGDKNWRVAATADINRDGNVDLIFQHTKGTLAVWQMNGSELSNALLFDPSHPGDFRWKVVGVGDLDGDSKADLIFQHADGTLATWRMDGTKLTSAALLDPPHPGDANWRVVAVGKYRKLLSAMASGDSERPEALTGQLDLIFQHRDYSLAVWFLNGTKLETAQLLKPPSSGATWRVVSPR